MRDLECRGASFPFSFQRRGFWLGNFTAASGRSEQLACQAGAAGWDRGNAAGLQACSQGRPWHRIPCPCASFFHQQLSMGWQLGTNTISRQMQHQQRQNTSHPLVSLHNNPYRKPAFPRDSVAPHCMQSPNPTPAPTPESHYPDPACFACHFQTTQESCIGQANPNAAMQTSPTIRYLERKKICPAT